MVRASDQWQKTWNSDREEVHNQEYQEYSCNSSGDMIHAVAVFYKRVTASANLFFLLREDEIILRHMVDN